MAAANVNLIIFPSICGAWILLFLLLPLVDGETKFSGGNGRSMEEAIVISADEYSTGILSQYKYIRENFPGCKRISQRMVGDDKGQIFDRLDIQCKETKFELYFDLTKLQNDFLGGMEEAKEAIEKEEL